MGSPKSRLFVARSGRLFCAGGSKHRMIVTPSRVVVQQRLFYVLNCFSSCLLKQSPILPSSLLAVDRISVQVKMQRMAKKRRTKCQYSCLLLYSRDVRERERETAAS